MNNTYWNWMFIWLIACTMVGWFLANGCTVNSTGPVNPDYEQLDTEAACDGLCTVLELYGCDGRNGSSGPDEQFGTDDDVSCRKQCRISVSLAPWMQDKASCGAAAKSCADVDDCMKRNP